MKLIALKIADFEASRKIKEINLSSDYKKSDKKSKVKGMFLKERKDAQQEERKEELQETKESIVEEKTKSEGKGACKEEEDTNMLFTTKHW